VTTNAGFKTVTVNVLLLVCPTESVAVTVYADTECNAVGVPLINAFDGLKLNPADNGVSIENEILPSPPLAETGAIGVTAVPL